MKDWVTGEEVQYTYDALQRLTRAETIGPEWGSTYGYDGFGNLLQKNPVKGTGVPLLNIAVDPWTNRVSGLSGGSYDANGNDLTAGAFDIANRLKQSGSTYFQYDAANKRVWKGTVAGGAITSEESYFYAPWGAKLAAYKPTNYLNVATMTIVSSNEYFGGKLIKINGTAVLMDRLGSNVSNGKRYFPYGEERGSTANNIEKFGTYFRDAETGLDYADQRYYKGSWGRFGSADPAGVRHIADTGLWNRFTYVDGDPVNRTDPTGLDMTCYWDGDTYVCVVVKPGEPPPPPPLPPGPPTVIPQIIVPLPPPVPPGITPPPNHALEEIIRELERCLGEAEQIRERMVKALPPNPPVPALVDFLVDTISPLVAGLSVAAVTSSSAGATSTVGAAGAGAGVGGEAALAFAMSPGGLAILGAAATVAAGSMIKYEAALSTWESANNTTLRMSLLEVDRIKRTYRANVESCARQFGVAKKELGLQLTCLAFLVRS